MQHTIDVLYPSPPLHQLPKLRKVARENYVKKRRRDKMEELRDDIADEEFLFGDMKFVHCRNKMIITSAEILLCVISVDALTVHVCMCVYMLYSSKIL